MSENTENHKRIAKNTLMLYFRMFFTMAISLYTSRVILEMLGVEDYGIYSAVAGVVVMFSFINSSMSSASSRFITMELGKGDPKGVQRVFSSSITAHIIVALIILLLAETFGLWFIDNKLVVPTDRFNVASILYQLSVVGIIISIILVPYNALIIAHERFSTYAYLDIFQSILKLVILYIIPLLGDDRLLTYGLLFFGASQLGTIIICIYCHVSFPTVKPKPIFDKSVLKEMLTFSGWDLYGNMSVMARTQGVNMLLNVFFGPLLNAASTLAASVQGAVGAFSNNVMAASRPQIFKLYAQKDYKASLNMMSQFMKISFTLMAMLSLPLLIETEYVLTL